MEEFEPAKLKLFGAAAGNNSWRGMTHSSVKPFSNERIIDEKRASFYAIKQLSNLLNKYEDIERIEALNHETRIYKVSKSGESFYIAWYESDKLVLPGDAVPAIKVKIENLTDKIVIEEMISADGQLDPKQTEVKTIHGSLEIDGCAT